MSGYEEQQYYYDYYAGSYVAQNPVETKSLSNAASTVVNTTPMKKSLLNTEEEGFNWDAEAKLPFKTVTLVGRKQFTPSRCVEMGDSAKPETWKLKNGGRVFMSVLNEDLTLDGGDKSDFREIYQILDEQHKEFACNGSSKQHSKKEKTKLSREHRDMIKSAELLSVTSNIKSEMVMEFHNIPAFNNEITRSPDGNICHTFLPGELSETIPTNHTILERSITNLAVAFQENFPGLTVENVDKQISYLNGGKHCLVPEDSAIAFFHNRDLPENEKVTQIHAVGDLPQIQLTRAQTEAAATIVKEKIGKNLSRANATGDTRISIHLPPTRDRIIEDYQFRNGVKGALPFLSFADVYHVMPEATKQEQEAYTSKNLWINYKLKITYCPDPEKL